MAKALAVTFFVALVLYILQGLSSTSILCLFFIFLILLIMCNRKCEFLATLDDDLVSDEDDVNLSDNESSNSDAEMSDDSSSAKLRAQSTTPLAAKSA